MTSIPLALPLDDIQGIILHGYGHLYQARFALLRVKPGYAGPARRFFASLNLTSASRAGHRGGEPGPFVNVAFTHGGLQALEVGNSLLDDFPRDFVEGPTTEARARLMGDQGASAPSTWAWGSDADGVHAMLLLYARDGIAELCEEYLQRAEGAGLDRVKCLETIRLPRRQEHFGFRDGISQPIVRNAGVEARPFNVAETGEFFLGHPNAFGEEAHVPGGTGFARHGSYLVARQLEQDVKGFWEFCRAATRSDEEAIRLASQMVGRWPSGSPLVQHPSHDAKPEASDEAKNDFEYATADPSGNRCPFGAHIRRSNPRDWGVAGTPEKSRTLVSHHRIIRRGRAYGRPLCDNAEPTSYLKVLGEADTHPDRGLHFLCFNANIERQFEFVQRQWCGNPKFAGLVNGADPLIGDHRSLDGDRPTFSLQREITPDHVPIARRFVRTRGAAYLFMPTISGVASLG
jgi:Dyp-type peroxidase family